jgi:hypothetical protein
MKKIHKIYIPIYGVVIYLGFETSLEEYIDLASKKSKVKNLREEYEDTIQNKPQGSFFGTSYNLFLHFDPNLKDLTNVAVHECFHATYYILNRANVYLDESSEEAYAYLLGFITDEVVKIIKAYKK